MRDLLRTRDKEVWVQDVEAALLTIPVLCSPTLEFVVLRPREGDSRIMIRIEGDAEHAHEVPEKVTAVIREALDVSVCVEVVPRHSLPRSGYKPERVVDA
jgi:phenylacetate-coenzyme A ligase PaaK-like adenylate-forming protein